MKEPKIKYCNCTLGAYSFDNNTIYLHHKLKNNPKLHDYVLKHELDHSKGNTMKETIKDGFDIFNLKKYYSE